MNKYACKHGCSIEETYSITKVSNKGAVRHVCRGLRQDIDHITRSLTWRGVAATSLPFPTTLPLGLMAACPGLRKIGYGGADALESLEGCCASLQELDVSDTSVSDLSPLTDCVHGAADAKARRQPPGRLVTAHCVHGAAKPLLLQHEGVRPIAACSMYRPAVLRLQLPD